VAASGESVLPSLRLTLGQAVKRLREHHGPPQPPPTSDPFELILLENVAYLAPPPRRRAAFELLKKTVGTSPAAILRATKKDLEKVTGHGILKGTFADKLRRCARIAAEDFGGDLGAALRQPVEAAKRALRAFPGIGEPGAEKILLFTGRHALLAPDSNALRVLVRLGLVREEKSYAKTYAAGRRAGEGLSAETGAVQEAHLLLQRHGQTLCRRSAPRCVECPLAEECAYARRERARRRPGGVRPNGKEPAVAGANQAARVRKRSVRSAGGASPYASGRGRRLRARSGRRHKRS